MRRKPGSARVLAPPLRRPLESPCPQTGCTLPRLALFGIVAAVSDGHAARNQDRSDIPAGCLATRKVAPVLVVPGNRADHAAADKLPEGITRRLPAPVGCASPLAGLAEFGRVQPGEPQPAPAELERVTVDHSGLSVQTLRLAANRNQRYRERDQDKGREKAVDPSQHALMGSAPGEDRLYGYRQGEVNVSEA